MSFKPAALDNKVFFDAVVEACKTQDIWSFLMMPGSLSVIVFGTSSLPTPGLSQSNDITSRPANQAAPPCGCLHPQSPAGTLLALLLKSREESASSSSLSIPCLLTSRKIDRGNRAVGGVVFRLESSTNGTWQQMHRGRGESHLFVILY